MTPFAQRNPVGQQICRRRPLEIETQWVTLRSALLILLEPFDGIAHTLKVGRLNVVTAGAVHIGGSHWPTRLEIGSFI